MQAHKLPSGRWRVQLFLGEADGHAFRKSFTADSKKEAERLAMEYKVKAGSYMIGDCSIEEAIDRYIGNRTGVLSPSTIRGYRTLQRNAYGSIAHLRAASITSEQIQSFVSTYALTHSAKSTRNAYGLLRAALDAVCPGKPINVRLPQKEVPQRAIPTDEDVKRLLDAAEQELRLAILIAATTTMRRGEICALCYEDITGNVIHVHRDVVQAPDGSWVVKDIPKTSSSDRYIDVPEKLIEEIGNGEGFVFSCTPAALSERFTRLRNRVGINTRFHDLRHYAASVMHAIGIPDQYIMERGGWSSDTILKSVYRNILGDKKNEFSQKTNKYMDKFF